MDNTQQVLPVTPDKGLSLRGLWQVLSSPSEFFAKLKDEPKILVPYVVFFLVMLVCFVLIADISTREEMKAMMDRPEFQSGNIPPQVEQWVRYSAMFLAPLMMLVLPLLNAVVFMFWGNFVFGGKAGFKQLLSVSLYGCIIFAVGFMATVPLILAKDSIAVSYSLAILVANLGVKSIAYQALSKFGVFYIWEIIVVGIGLSTVYGVSRNKGYVISVLSLGLLSALQVGLTALGTAFN